MAWPSESVRENISPALTLLLWGMASARPARAGLVVRQKLPQLPRPVAIEGTEGHHLPDPLDAVLKDDDAVHVAAAPAR